MRVLVIEDEPAMAQLLHRGLTEEGYAVDVAVDGVDGLGSAVSRPYDAVVLDVMLPGLDGFEVCERLRAQQSWVPVLMLTARAAVTDRIGGLDLGADDYVVKPFHFDELCARLRALIRRGPVPRPTVLQVGDLRVDPAQRRCWCAGTEIMLTGKEFELLCMFARQPGVVLSRDQLTEHCWDFAYESRSNVIDVHIRGLRRKLGEPSGGGRLETVRGLGYRLRPAPDRR